MENQLIKISKKNKEHYENLLSIFDKMKTFTISSYGTSATHEEIFKQANKILQDNIKNQDKLNFKEFILDIKDSEEIVEISHETYEKYINIKQIFKNFENIKNITHKDFENTIKIWCLHTSFKTFYD